MIPSFTVFYVFLIWIDLLMASAIKPFDFSKLPVDLQSNAHLRTEIVRIHDEFQVIVGFSLKLA